MKSIAIVEDNEDNSVLLEAMLGEDYRLSMYADGPSALASMPDAVPDLILLDISLPGMSGVDVLKALRADDTLRSIPVAAVTAHAMTGDRERYLARGFDEHIAKPITDEDLLRATIERLLARD